MKYFDINIQEFIDDLQMSHHLSGYEGSVTELVEDITMILWFNNHHVQTGNSLVI